MMLSISKSISRYDNEVRLGNFKKNASEIETLELFNKEVLIVGFGRIGKSLIKRCLGFEMKVNVYDPFVSKEIISQFGGNKIDNLDDGLKSCDYLSLHIPLTEKTKNMINGSKLNSMKKTAIIINTSRGGIINEIDLDNALNEKIIFGIGASIASFLFFFLLGYLSKILSKYAQSKKVWNIINLFISTDLYNNRDDLRIDVQLYTYLKYCIRNNTQYIRNTNYMTPR